MKPSRISRSQSLLCKAMIAHLDKRIHIESRYTFPEFVTLHNITKIGEGNGRYGRQWIFDL